MELRFNIADWIYVHELLTSSVPPVTPENQFSVRLYNSVSRVPWISNW